MIFFNFSIHSENIEVNTLYVISQCVIRIANEKFVSFYYFDEMIII